ncbi:MAG: hypothetical protein QM791_06485 [Ferruginibacter sp.]
MKQQDLTTLNLEELKQKEKTLKTSLGIFIGLSIVLVTALIFMYVKQKATAVAVAPFVSFIAMIALMIFNKKLLLDVQKEISKRESK